MSRPLLITTCLVRNDEITMLWQVFWTNGRFSSGIEADIKSKQAILLIEYKDSSKYENLGDFFKCR